MRDLRVSRLIAQIRANDPPYMRDLFMNGACFHLWEILRVVWPEAEPWRSITEYHVYVKIGADFYDIRGRRSKPPSDLVPLDSEHYGEAATWLPERLMCDEEWHGHLTRRKHRQPKGE